MIDEATERKFYTEGYIAGWRSILGKSALPSHIPEYKLLPGKSAYEQGYEQGRAFVARPSSLFWRHTCFWFLVLALPVGILAGLIVAFRGGPGWLEAMPAAVIGTIAVVLGFL